MSSPVNLFSSFPPPSVLSCIKYRTLCITGSVCRPSQRASEGVSDTSSHITQTEGGTGRTNWGRPRSFARSCGWGWGEETWDGVGDNHQVYIYIYILFVYMCAAHTYIEYIYIYIYVYSMYVCVDNIYIYMCVCVFKEGLLKGGEMEEQTFSLNLFILSSSLPVFLDVTWIPRSQSHFPLWLYLLPPPLCLLEGNCNGTKGASATVVWEHGWPCKTRWGSSSSWCCSAVGFPPPPYRILSPFFYMFFPPRFSFCWTYSQRCFNLRFLIDCISCLQWATAACV